MKTIEDILEALLVNTIADFTESEPNLEFKAIYDDLLQIQTDSKNKQHSERIIWSIEDIYERAKEKKIKITMNEASYILEELNEQEHYSTEWELIDHYLYDYK